MSGAAGNVPPRPRPDSGAFGEKLIGALVGRALGDLPDKEKAEILENVEESNRDLLDSIQSLDESVNALGNLLNLWTRILVEWSHSGGKSVASLQSVIRDVTEQAAAEAAEEEEEEPADDEDEGEGDEADDEADDVAEGKVIDVEGKHLKT